MYSILIYVLILISDLKNPESLYVVPNNPKFYKLGTYRHSTYSPFGNTGDLIFFGKLME